MHAALVWHNMRSWQDKNSLLRTAALITALPACYYYSTSPLAACVWTLLLALCTYAGRAQFLRGFGLDLRDTADASTLLELELALSARLGSKSLREVFEELAASQQFRTRFWERAPLVIRRHGEAPPDTVSLTLDDVAAAGLKTSRHAWFSQPAAPIKAYDGSDAAEEGAYEPVAVSSAVGEGVAVDASLLAQQLRAGRTFSASGVGMLIPQAAHVCLDASDAFRLPVNANLYCSARGLRCAVAPHSDAEDNLIVQMHGSKRWVLTRPRAADALPVGAKGMMVGKHGQRVPRVYRGEADDATAAAAAKEEEADDDDDGGGGEGGEGGESGEGGVGTPRQRSVVLRAGDVLYVPRGWIHRTSTAGLEPGEAGDGHGDGDGDGAAESARGGGDGRGSVEGGASVHLTVSVHSDTTHATAHCCVALASRLCPLASPPIDVERCFLKRSGALDKATRAERRLRAALPLGFLAGASRTRAATTLANTSSGGGSREASEAGVGDDGGVAVRRAARRLCALTCETLPRHLPAAEAEAASDGNLALLLGLGAHDFEAALRHSDACTRATVATLARQYAIVAAGGRREEGGVSGSDGGCGEYVQRVFDEHASRLFGAAALPALRHQAQLAAADAARRAMMGQQEEEYRSSTQQGAEGRR